MYTMKETCERTGLTYETLKFYCNQGIIPNVKRDKNNHRIFDDNNISWIQNLSCLKNCGMGLSEMKCYIDLCLLGESTIPERKDILRIKRNGLQEQMKTLQECLDYIDWEQSLQSIPQHGIVSGRDFSYLTSLFWRSKPRTPRFTISAHLLPLDLICGLPSQH